MKEREDRKQLRLAKMRKEIAVGVRQADRNVFVDGPEVFSKIRQRSARRSKG